MNGIYIHIPFCKSKCPYCDFHSGRCNTALQKEYVDALVDEMVTRKRMREFVSSDSIYADTLYIGGGTPSVLDAEDLGKIILTAKKEFNIDTNAEITVECNPSSDIESLIPIFKRCGVNRVSLGMQSAVDSERRSLGRQADSNRVKAVINLLKKAGIQNVSLDIMLGIPDQTKSSLTQSLEFIKESGATHVSAYILKIEDGTFFDAHRERYNLPTDDETCELYEYCAEYLENTGFEHYEISNFAKKGFESRHNTKYWQLDSYIGIGAAAHSFFDGKRFYHKADTVAFIEGEPAIFDCYGNDAEEYIMLQLRLKKGLDINKLIDLYGEEVAQKIKQKAPTLKKNGLVNFDDNTISLTRKGFLLSNSIIAELI